MIPLLALAIVLRAQVIPILPSQGGTIRGTVTYSNREPASRVRVSVTPRPGTGDEVSGASLSVLTETDEKGRFVLENVPPGKYLIVAGRIDQPTYYPGVGAPAAGSIVEVVAGGTADGLDFVLLDASAGRAGISIAPVPANNLTFPLRVEMEGGEKIPVRGPAGPVAVRLLSLTQQGAAVEVPLSESSINVTVTSGPTQASMYEFAVTAINLPDGYVVKSFTYEQTDLRNSPLRLQVPVLPVTGYTISSALAILAISRPLTASPVHLVLERIPTSGPRVLGRARPGAVKPIYMSGRQGTVFSDGTFEFGNVPSGRHVIAWVDMPGRAMGATVVVEQSDVTGIQLEDVLFLPVDITASVNPAPAGGLRGGDTIAPATVRGHVLDEATGAPVGRGRIFVSGPLSPPISIQNGQFEIQSLLPGRYNLDIEVYGYPAIRREVVVGVSDVAVDVAVAKN